MEEKNQNSQSTDCIVEYNHEEYKQQVFQTGSNLFYNDTLVYSVNNSNPKYTYETYYSINGIYNVLTNSSGSRVAYIPEEFVEYEKRLSSSIRNFTNGFNTSSVFASIKTNLGLKYFSSKTNTVKVCENDNLFLAPYDQRVMEYKVMKNIYPKLTLIMPYFHAKEVLEDTLSQINKFITTNNLDMNHINENLNSIRKCEFCVSSISLLEKFTLNPQKANINELVDKLSHYIQNINNFIEINTSKDVENYK